MTRFGWRWRILAALLLLVAGGLAAAHFYLSSAAVARQVAGEVGSLLGAPVEVGSASVGLVGSSTIGHLTIGQAGEPSGEPLLTADRVRADLSVVGALSGASVKEVELSGARVRLHFDAAGNLLTRMPQPPPGKGGAQPRIVLRDARFTLAQDGHPELDLHGINGELAPAGEIKGGFTDPAWGTWTLGGALDLNANVLNLDLKTEGANLAPGRVEQVPFVPPAIWQRVTADGPRVPLGLALKIVLGTPKAGESAVHYRVEFADARVSIPQTEPSRKPFVVQPAGAVVEGDAAEVKLTGQIHDAVWGEWAVNADCVTKTGAVDLRLVTKEAHVKGDLLPTLPYVPLSIWDEVRVDGTTPGDVTVQFFTDKPQVHYRVAIEPRGAVVRVPSIGLEADDTSGKVLVEDGRVILTGVEGRTAGGTLRLNGDLHFVPEPDAALPDEQRLADNRLHFKIDAQAVVLNQLPKGWKIQDTKIDGKLTGKADLTLLITGGKLKTMGSGDGEIADAHFAGFPTAKPIPLHLHSDGKGFRFATKASPTALVDPFLLLYPALADEPPPPSGPVGLLSQPGRIAELITSGIGRATTEVGDRTAGVLKEIARVTRAPEPGKEPSYLDANLELQDVDLGDLLRRLDLRLPIAVAGRLSFKVQLSVPINTPNDVKAYKVRGSASLPRLEVAGFAVANLKAQVTFLEGVLRLTDFSGQLPRKAGKPGTFAGTATVGVAPLGDLNTSLQVEDVPLEVLLSLMPGVDKSAGGTLSGLVRLRAPVAKLADPAAARGTVVLRSPRLDAYGQTLTGTEVSAGVDGGVLTVSDFKAKLGGVEGGLPGGDLRGSGTLRLNGPMAYQGRVTLADFDLASLDRLPPAYRLPVGVAGSATVEAVAEGTLAPPAGKTALTRVGGTASARRLVVTQEKTLRVEADSLTMDWRLGDAGLALSDIRAKLYDGSVTGTALVPLSAAQEGKADLGLDNIDVKKLAAAVGKVPVRVEGKATGTVKGTLSAAPKAGAARPMNVAVDVDKPGLRVQGFPTDKARVTLDTKDDVTAYKIEALALGGKIKLEGKLPPSKPGAAPEPKEPAKEPAKAPESPDDPGGTVSVRNISLNRLAAAFGVPEELRPTGRLEIEFRYHYARPELSAFRGSGQIRLRDLMLGEHRLASSVRGDLRLANGLFRLRNFTARLAGGELAVSLRYRLDGRNPDGSVHVTLRGAEASELLGGFPGLSGVFLGPIDLTFRSTLGAEMTGEGTADIGHGRVSGVEIGEWHIPFRFSAAPGRGHLELRVSESGIQLGHGRGTVAAEIQRDGAGLRVRGSLNVTGAEVRHLVSGMSETSSYAQGRVNARIEFGGSDVRSANDLTADIRADLHQVQALQLPGLNLLLPFLRLGNANTLFDKGDLKGQLRGGVLRVQHMTLTGKVASLVLEGNVSLAGRLDLEVTARTGSFLGIDPAVLRALSLGLPVVGPVPVGLIIRASDVLSSQVIHLRLTGTTKNPQVQVEPVKILTETAVRFLLLGAAGGGTP